MTDPEVDPEELPLRLLPEDPPCEPLELPKPLLSCELLELPLGLVLLPLGLVLEPLGLVLLEPALELSDRIANSIRPEFGFTIVSLMVPSVWLDEPVTLAPINWLALIDCCPIRPVALH